MQNLNKLLIIFGIILTTPLCLRYFKVRYPDGTLIIATQNERDEDYLDRSGFNPYDDFAKAEYARLASEDLERANKESVEEAHKEQDEHVNKLVNKEIEKVGEYTYKTIEQKSVGKK